MSVIVVGMDNVAGETRLTLPAGAVEYVCDQLEVVRLLEPSLTLGGGLRAREGDERRSRHPVAQQRTAHAAARLKRHVTTPV